MTTLIDSMVERAKADKKTIVLPEGHDDRILAAAEETLKQGIANLVILGDAEEINAKGYNLEGAEIINPATSDKVDEFASLLFELRKKKGMTEAGNERQHLLCNNDGENWPVRRFGRRRKLRNRENSLPCPEGLEDRSRRAYGKLPLPDGSSQLRPG